MARRSPSVTRVFLAVVTGGLFAAVPALGAGPADPLLRLTPSDASVTLTLENLRDHAAEWLASRVVRGLRDTPSVRRWVKSDGWQQFRRSLSRVETALGVDLPTLRDGLLGEAVVLALRTPEGAAPDAARGLLLARVPDRALLERLILGVNAAQTRDGELTRVEPRTRGDVSYSRRVFRPGSRPDEFYAVFEDGVFAWSNEESLIQGVIDRRAGGPGGLGALAAFREVRRRLPDRALLGCYVDPRFAARLLASAPPPTNPSDRQLAAMLGRYVDAVRYAGAALSWHDGPVLHVEQSMDGDRLDPSLKRWAARPGNPDSRLTRVSPRTLALANLHVDAPALLDGVRALTPQEDRPKLDTLLTAVRGVLLGLDPREDFAPRLGPWVALQLERPDAGIAHDADVGLTRFPAVLTVPVAETPEQARVLAAAENALRTLLALAALDPRHGGGKFRVEGRTEPTSGASVVHVEGGHVPLAFAVHAGRVLVGTGPDAVTRALAAQADPKAASRFPEIRSRAFPRASSFACLDLRALDEFATPRRKGLERRLAARQNQSEEAAVRDLDQALALVRLFDAAYLTGDVDPSFTGVSFTLGLLARPSPGDTTP